MKIKLFSLALLFTGIVYSQNKIDSLLQVLAVEKVDTSKTKIYLQLGELYARSVPDTAIYYYKKGLKISETIDNEKYTAKFFTGLGKVYYDIGNYIKSLEYHTKALNIYKKIGDKKGEAIALRGMGMVYRVQSDYDKALQFYNESLQINTEIDDQEGRAKDFTSIGRIQSLLGSDDKAIEYFQKSLQIAEELKLDNYIAASYVNIGIIFERQKNYDKAITYYEKAKDIDKKINDIYGLGIDYANLGKVYILKEDLDKAINNTKKAIAVFKKMGNKHFVAMLYQNLDIAYESKGDFKGLIKNSFKRMAILEELGDKKAVAQIKGNIAKVYNRLKQYNKAITYASSSLKMAKELGLIERQQYSANQLSDAYLGLNNYKKALEYKNLEVAAKDSIFNIAKTEKINEIQTKYETEKKELEIAKKAVEIDALEKSAKMNKIFLIATALVLGLIILSLYLFFKQRLIRSKHKADLFNQKLLRLQMNPHFIFNTLTSIQSYMFEKDTKKAAMYLSSFSKLTRSILDGSRKDFVSLQEDYDNNDNYLKIQQMRFDNLFDYTISIDDDIDPDTVQIAPMLIQPFIENAVIHGFKDIDYQGHLKIVYKKVKDTIQITVEDNGKGKSVSNNENHKSHALSITKERLSILNKKYKKDITFKVNSSYKGYKVLFTVPYKVA